MSHNRLRLALLLIALLFWPVLARGADVDVEGRWQLETGAVLEFSGHRYRVLQQDGAVAEQGEYWIDDAILFTESETGDANLFAYTRDGDQLLLDTVDGQRITLRPAASEPATTTAPADTAEPGAPDSAQTATSPPSTEGSAAGPISDGTALADEWVATLRGKRITRMEQYSSGTGGGYWSKRVLDLCTDGRFFFQSASSVAVYTEGGGDQSSGDTEESTGRWSVFTEGDAAGLELKQDEGKGQVLRLDYNEGTYLNGDRAYVTQNNESCP